LSRVRAGKVSELFLHAAPAQRFPLPETNPPHDCPRCPRLVAFRHDNQRAYPDFFNAPVPTWGDAHPGLMIVGLAPGLKGANRTGRPFTGDYAGDLLYATLKKFGLATGHYQRRPDDGLELRNVLIANAVRCVPPQNKPTGDEIKTCRPFLGAAIEHYRPRAFLALGRIAHDSLLSALGEKRSKFAFGHGAEHELSSGATLFDSYHCSRYNTNTGVLTTAMFEDVVGRAAWAIAA
jgi:uracil-DNA glycosylase family 4